MTRIPNPIALKDVVGPRKLTAGQQISRMMTLLQRLSRDKATEELFVEICAWASDLPDAKRPEALASAIAQSFGKTVEEIDLALKQIDRRVEFDGLVPRAGWIHDYVNWTRQTEPPSVFHFFVAATVIGAALGRQIFFDKGAYQVYPNLCVMIVAPTGRCRKTSACNVGTGLYQKVGGTLIADKTTPEAFVDTLKTQVNATGLIYAPELAVFLGKQKYQEGMIPLLTALFDCPKEWTSKTMGRGDTTLTNVALSALFCSTIDWIKTSIPAESFGGGFMSRFLFVIQESTARSFPLPPPMDAEVKKTLITQLTRIKNRRGQFIFSPQAEAWYRKWYDTRPNLQGDKQYAGYYERKPDHIIRLAMLLRVACDVDSKDLTLSDMDLVHANKILTWLEGFLPATFDEMTSSSAGEDQARILRHLRQAGGTMEHSLLLRKNSSKINAEQFKRSLGTLREAKLVDWDAVTKSYVLTPEGWM